MGEIRKLLPRRYPMLLIDQVLDVVPGERLTAFKAITCNEPWYATLRPDDIGEDFAYPETLVLESWGQSAAILANLSGFNPDGLSGRVMLLGSMSGVNIVRRVYPGQVVEHRVRVFRALSDIVIFNGESLVDGELVATISRMVMTFRTAEVVGPVEPAPAPL